MKIIRLNQNQLNEFWNLRLALFRELGEVKTNDQTAELEESTKDYYQAHIDKDLFSWGAMNEGKLIAVGSLCLFNRVPYLENVSGLEGYILSIYTSSKFRKQGIASEIVSEIKKFAKEKGIRRLWLNSSDNGKTIYSKAGFIPKGNEMEIML